MINSPSSAQAQNQPPDPASKFNGNADSERRMLAPYLVTVLLFAVVGLIFGWLWGAAVAAVLGSLYTFIAWASAGSYLYDLHEGELLDVSRAPETYKFSEEMAESLGIDPPTIYRMNVDQPQICVSAIGTGSRARGRIGISKGFFEHIHSDQLQVLLAVSMARIATGEATLISKASALACFPLQFAQSRSVNFSIGPIVADPECGLNFLGKFFLIVFTPLSRIVLALAQVRVSVLRCDLASTRIGHRSFEPIRVEAALRWLQKQQPPALTDPMVDFNPAEASAYLVSPFETDFDPETRAATVQPPLWKRCRFLVSSAAPSLAERIAALESAGAKSSTITSSRADKPSS